MFEKSSNTAPIDRMDLLAYRNLELPFDERVADLLGRMVLEEKVDQMLCIWDL